jgi:hypothetical protein
MSNILAVTYEDAESVTLSNTVPDPDGPFAALQATNSAGTAKVTTIRGTPITIYLPLGTIVPLAVNQVWNTANASAMAIVGFKANPYKGPTGP